MEEDSKIMIKPLFGIRNVSKELPNTFRHTTTLESTTKLRKTTNRPKYGILKPLRRTMTTKLLTRT